MMVCIRATGAELACMAPVSKRPWTDVVLLQDDKSSVLKQTLACQTGQVVVGILRYFLVGQWRKQTNEDVGKAPVVMIVEPIMSSELGP